MGHWYNPPPSVQPAVHAPVGTPAPPNPIGALGQGAKFNALLSAWPPESWPAQSGDTVASQLAAAWSNAPPNPIGSGAQFDAIRSMWPQESWPAQSGDIVAGGLAPLAPAARSAVGPIPLAVAVAINAAWPPEQWGTQIAGDTASLLAVVTTPVIFPSPLRILRAAVASTWLPESWYAQSESGIASGIAQIQLPPIYQPWSTTSRMALLRSLWLPEVWPSQVGARYAAWIPLPVTAVPTAIRHPEILLWTADTWGAQSGTRAVSILATAPASQPYANRWLAAALRSAWAPEDWPVQTFPDIAAGTSPLPPPLPRSPSQFTISLWPVEFWGSQPGARGAAILASPQLLIFMPYVVGKLEIVAVAQLQSLFAPVITLQYVFSGAPPLTVVAQSIPRGTLVFPGEAVTLQISLGRQHGPAPCPIVESILVSNIPVVMSILPPNKKVIH